jgi:hypothetical protein
LAPLGAHPHDVADDDDRRRLDPALGSQAGDRRDGAHGGALVGLVAALDDRHRAGAGASVGDEQLGRPGQLGHAHEQDERVVASGRQDRDLVVTGHDGEAARDAAVGDRDARRSGHADRARHA